MGAIIGAGIFTLSGTAIALAGTWALASFVLVGLVAVIVALELGELCSLFPGVKGASYSYAYEAFGSELGFITGILLYFSFASSISVVALGFGSYLASLLGLQLPYSADYFAIALIAVLALLNLRGIRKAARADFALVLLRVQEQPGKVLEQVKQTPIHSAYVVPGEFDIVATVSGRDHNEVLERAARMAEIPGVEESETVFAYKPIWV